jgi:methyltransferase family protein
MIYLEIEPFALKEPPQPDCELAALAYSGRFRRIHKWTHYFQIYERYLEKYRGKPCKMLEIGVSGGGSLNLWREYFGPHATIYGIDINSNCAELDTPETPVRIGSQADPNFLRTVVSEMGSIDVVLDDGSHKAAHQRTSFEVLFPLLSDGGLYIIEDSHTSYWFRFNGGLRRKGTAIEFAKRLVDDMHGWYHRGRTKSRAQHEVGTVAFHDSMIVIEKRCHGRPGHVIVESASALSA